MLKKFSIIVLTVLLSASISYGQTQPQGGGTGVRNPTTVGALPTAEGRGRLAWVTDGQSSAPCTAGNGAVMALCCEGATAWSTCFAGVYITGNTRSVTLDNSTFDGIEKTFADMVPSEPDLNSSIVIFLAGVPWYYVSTFADTRGTFSLSGANNRTVTFGSNPDGRGPEKGDIAFIIYSEKVN